jgi:carboxymethylenebutenolidase
MRSAWSCSALLIGLATAGHASAQESSIPDAIVGQAAAPRGQAVPYLAGDGATRGYLAVPEGAGPFPALILVHEWNGLVDRVRQVADALAARGYVVLAADLYAGRIGTSQQENVALMREAQGNPDGIIANLDGAQRFLRGRSDVTGKVGVMGWCFGGGVSLSYALGGEAHDATAIFYGSLITDPAELSRLHHPVYGTFAGQDRGIPVDQVRRFAAVLDSLGVRNDIHIYDPVAHGFWLWVERDRERNEAPAADAWGRLTRFLDETLRGGR